MLYVSTPSGRVIALDGDTGREAWTFRPSPRDGRKEARGAHRGVSYWESSDGTARRILGATPDGRLFAVWTEDHDTPWPQGKQSGEHQHMAGDRAPSPMPATAAATTSRPRFGVSSPPAIYRDLVITGSLLQEYPARGPAGDVRAYDMSTGALVWQFHTVPRPGERGHDTWEGEGWKDRSGVNVWSVMSVDTERGLVFLPLGSATYDFYGGDRKGANLYANALVALDAATGAVVWHFQTVHHDLWDYDLPAQPTLVTVRKDGRDVPAVAQVSKSGFVFVLDRVTGQPLFPVEERPVPASTVPGEAASPTQPIPVRPPFRPPRRLGSPLRSGRTTAHITPSHTHRVFVSRTRITRYRPSSQPEASSSVSERIVGGWRCAGTATERCCARRAPLRRKVRPIAWSTAAVH